MEFVRSSFEPTRRMGFFCSLVIAVLALPAAVSAAPTSVTVCNEGDVKLLAAVLHIDEGRLGRWDVAGWYTIKPRGCTQVDSGGGFSNLVFAVSGPDGSFGVVKYESKNGRELGGKNLKELCVTPGYMKDGGGPDKPYDKYLAPCPRGYKLAPTSGTVYISGYATMTLNVKPLSEDYKDSLTRFSAAEIDAAPDAPSPSARRSPRVSPFLRRIELYGACKRDTDDMFEPSLTRYCNCTVDAILSSEVDEAAQDKLAAKFSDANREEAQKGNARFAEQWQRCRQ